MDNELVLIVGTAGMLLLTLGVILFIYLYQRKLGKRKIEYQKIKDLLKEQELKSAYVLMEGQDMERKRIAQELHDNLGSIFATLLMYIDTANNSKENSKTKSIISKIRELTTKASEETRQLSHQLDVGALDRFGLKQALLDLVQAIEEVESIGVHHNIQLSSGLNGITTFNLYRIIQELITNTLKHAEASEIHLDVNQINEEYISLIYSDNGVGMDEHSTFGMGLKNIISRVEKLEGEYNVTPEKRGFHMTIEIPIK